MAINRIKTGGITDGTITTTDIAPGTIANDRLAGSIANDKLAGSIANAKLANSAITINGTSIALGASGEIVAGTDWQAVTVADGSTNINAAAGEGYFLDTNAGVIEVKLPASPSRGDTIKIVDYGGNFATNNVLINMNGQNLDSTDLGFFKLSTNDQLVEIVYVDSNKGWLFYQSQTQVSTPSSALVQGQLGLSPSFTQATGGTVTTSGDYKIHSFTGDGTFAVTAAGNLPTFCGLPQAPQAGPNKVDYMVVAGGGGGGTGIGGGGGGGGFRESHVEAVSGPYTASPLASCGSLTITPGNIPVTVGAGGSGTAPAATGGSDSVFSTITSAGGGHWTPCACTRKGGSGSGGGHQGQGGVGNFPPVSPPQGNAGGNNSPGPISSGQFAAGGGGGAGAAGSPASSNGYQSLAGGGGNGTPTNITGSGVTYAGGGGGGTYANPGDGGGSGGTGGGGEGKAWSGGAGTAGQANTGGGGGGGTSGPGNPKCGYAGGKGIVVVRYKYQ